MTFWLHLLFRLPLALFSGASSATAACCLLLAVTAATGCGGTDEAPPEDDPPEDLVTWSEQVRPIVETNCTVCHHTGGSAPFAFETYEDVAAASTAMLDAMRAGRMPPWPADRDCRTYVNERTLDAADLATFEQWVEGGTPEGEPTEAIVVEQTAFEPTVVTAAQAAYTPDLSSAGDDYRCFLLDLDVEAPMFVQGSTVRPGTEAVHHVLVYALAGAQVAEAEALDADDDGEGYTCFGGPLPRAPGEGEGMMVGGGGGNLVTQIAGWVPGAEPTTLPDELGIPIEAGARIVMQIHYSAVGGAAQPDHTELLLRMTDEAPAFIQRTVPMAIPEIDIPAGADDVQFSKLLTNFSDAPVTIAGFTGHMHLLGTSISATHVACGGAEQCGLNIPAWDFNWQLSYALPEEDHLVVEPGDAIRVACAYDNSAANQAVVDGVQVEPVDVTWGEGSLDEMCLVYASIIQPYVPPADEGAGVCASAEACYAESDGSFGALLACEEGAMTCGGCALQNGIGCGMAPCLLSLAPARTCLVDCVMATNAFGGSMDTCMRASCGDEYDALLTCADPVMQSGTCDEAMGTCGLSPGVSP